ncbi:unnamed protein product [Rhizophagus irregularis]|uniref:Uncharacterized protein n=1 Tax=Rhizophagus irregularis TaxID=588596 RepID=A0A916EGW1_9GLOM|nr:unnamed protein product [Rhizophagus irregularis]
MYVCNKFGTMSYDKYTLSITSRNKIQELKKHLEDGNINTSTDSFKSNFNSKDHVSIIYNWILSYGSNEQTRQKIAGLKSQSFANLRKIFTETINDGKKLTIFILKFTGKNTRSEYPSRSEQRTYYESCVNVELTSSIDDSKRLINSYFMDLAVLVLSGGSDSYTLSIE